LIIDFRSDDPKEKTLAYQHVGSHCFLDGKEIQQAYYVDTDAGIAKSYDVLGDGKVHETYERSEWPEGVEEIGHGSGIMSITLHGRVQILPPFMLADAPFRLADGGEVPAGKRYLVGE
jgi:hypothetical protein